jgi:hypothetical protein
MKVKVPKIDERTFKDILEKARGVAPFYAPEWNASVEKEAGGALLKLFIHMLEAVISRMNKVPDKNFVDFLDMLGMKLLPARSARGPITFQLTEGTTEEVLVPGGTQVSAPATDEHEEQIFETEKNMLATYANLTHVFSTNPSKDEIFNHTTQFLEKESFKVFSETNSQEHILYLAHTDLFNIKSDVKIVLKLHFSTDSAGFDKEKMVWEYWDGENWNGMSVVENSTKISKEKTFQLSGVLVIEKSCKGEIVEKEVNRIKSRWIRCRLLSSISPIQSEDLPLIDTIKTRIDRDPGSILLPDLAFSQDIPLDLTEDTLLSKIRAKMLGIKTTDVLKFVSNPNPAANQYPIPGDTSAWLNDVRDLEDDDRLRFSNIEDDKFEEQNISIIKAESILLLADTAPDDSDAFGDMFVDVTRGTGSGQIRKIETYDSQTKEATVVPEWDILPDETSDYRIIDPIYHGKAQDAGDNNIKLEQHAPDCIDKYIDITGGVGIGQIRKIKHYADNTKKEATVEPDWDIVPDTTSDYRIIKQEHDGTAQGSDSSITLDPDAPDEDYVGKYIDITGGAGSGQIRKITEYNIININNEPKKIVAVAPNLDTLPNDTSDYRIIDPVHYGKAQGADNSSITLADSASDTNDAYKDMQIDIIGGAGSGQMRRITSYEVINDNNGTKKIADVDPPWDSENLPDSTSDYRIIDPVHYGTAQGGDARIILADSASGVNDDYKDMYIDIIRGTGSGQMRKITAYYVIDVDDGTKKIASIDSIWDTFPDNTSVYRIIESIHDGTVKVGVERHSGKIFWTVGLKNEYNGDSKVKLLTAIRPKVNGQADVQVEVRIEEGKIDDFIEEKSVNLVRNSDDTCPQEPMPNTAIIKETLFAKNKLKLERKDDVGFPCAYYEGDELEYREFIGRIYPFGQEPRLFSTFYIASQEVFSKRGAKITITMDITLKGDDAPTDQETPQISWEYWGGKGWKLLRLTEDQTSDFNKTDEKDLAIVFFCPNDIKITEVSGQENYWIRARLIAGDYGKKFYYDDSLPGFIPGNITPPVIIFNSLTYELPLKPIEYCLTFNNLKFEDHSGTCKSQGQQFKPFQPLDHRNSALHLGFDNSLKSGPINIFFSLVEQLIPESSKPKIDWTYWNGSLWAASNSVDNTASLTRSDALAVVGSKDFAKKSQFGHELYWLRGELQEGKFESDLVVMNGIYPNTAWAFQAARMADEILGASDGTPDQEFSFLRSPILSQEIWVNEPNLPTDEEQKKILQEEGQEAIKAIKDDEGRTIGTWIRWHEVMDFYDSGTSSRHYTVDRAMSKIMFGDGEQGMIPPKGENNIKATYRYGGGIDGNVDAEEINSLKSAVPFVKSVINHEEAGGGTNTEEIENVFVRAPQSLKHRNRAITSGDYEWLARDASQYIARVKCLPNTNNLGQFETGWVTLIIVPDSKETQPQPSAQLITSVERYLGERCVNTVFTPDHLYITGPSYVEVQVDAEIVAVAIDKVATVGKDVLNTLNTFFHPLTGGFKGSGWEFGRKVCISEVYKLIEEIDDVDYVRNLSLIVGGTIQGDSIAIDNNSLVCSGEHTIEVTIT